MHILNFLVRFQPITRKDPQQLATNLHIFRRPSTGLSPTELLNNYLVTSPTWLTVGSVLIVSLQP